MIADLCCQVDAMRDSIAKLLSGVVDKIDAAIDAKMPLTLMDGRTNDGVYMDRKTREGEVARSPNTTVPSLTKGAHSCLQYERIKCV